MKRKEHKDDFDNELYYLKRNIQKYNRGNKLKIDIYSSKFTLSFGRGKVLTYNGDYEENLELVYELLIGNYELDNYEDGENYSYDLYINGVLIDTYSYKQNRPKQVKKGFKEILKKAKIVFHD